MMIDRGNELVVCTLLVRTILTHPTGPQSQLSAKTDGLVQLATAPLTEAEAHEV